MTCPSSQEAENRLKSFEVRYILNGPYGGSATVSDVTCIDGPGCGEVCAPLSIGIDSTIDSYSCDGEEISNELSTCYSQSPLWLNGIMRTYGRSNKDGTTNVSVSSYFDYLRSKPINTQQFFGAYLSTVFDVIFTYYTGTPNHLLNIVSYNDIQIKGPVEGNDTLAELMTLAQAGRAHIFVQVGGILTIEKWKDHNDVTEFIIPPELTISAEPSDYKRSETTVIRIRGSSVSKKECGDKPLTNNEFGPGTTNSCVIVGVSTPSASMTQNNLTGTKEDILAGVEISDIVARIGNKKTVEDGTYSGNYRLKDGSYFGPTPKLIPLLLKGKTQSKEQEAYFGHYFGANKGKGYRGGNTFFNTLPQLLQGLFPVPYSMFGLGAFGSIPFVQNINEDSDSYSDQPSFQQAETVAISPDISQCGVKYEEITNKYMPIKEQLFDLAVRRFQEIKLADTTWNVEVTYIPCLKLNQMVEFTVPETEECPMKVVKGIIGGIDLDYGLDEEGIATTKMRLSVMDVSCLGYTQYTSGNLVASPCAGENSGDLNPWLTSALNIESTASVDNGVISLYAYGTGAAGAAYTHPHMEIGATYDWEFDYETLAGWGLVTYSFPNGIFGTGGGNLTGSGSKSGSFQAVAATGVWDFNMPTPASPTYMRIKNLTIRKTIIA